MSISRKAWAVSGLAHLAVVLGVCIGVATSQGQLPIGDSRPIPKPVAVAKSSGIATVSLENLTPAAKPPDTVELKPGQLKAFASGDGVSWDLVPKSDDATDDGLVLEEAAAGTVVFAYSVDVGRWSKLKVPDGQQVILVAANPIVPDDKRPNPTPKYLLTKMEVVGGKVKIVERVYINVVVTKKPDPVVIDDKGDDTKPKPPVKKARKLAAIVIEETEDKSAARSRFFGDKALVDYWTAKGHTPFVVVDQNVKEGKTNLPPAKLVPYLNRAKGKTLPQVYLVDVETGDVVLEREIPATLTAAEFLKLAQEVGG